MSARIPFPRAIKADCIHRHDYVLPYVNDLGSVVDMESIAAAGIRIGIDPLGGAAVDFWDPILPSAMA